MSDQDYRRFIIFKKCVNPASNDDKNRETCEQEFIQPNNVNVNNINNVDDDLQGEVVEEVSEQLPSYIYVDSRDVVHILTSGLVSSIELDPKEFKKPSSLFDSSYPPNCVFELAFPQFLGFCRKDLMSGNHDHIFFKNCLGKIAKEISKFFTGIFEHFSLGKLKHNHFVVLTHCLVHLYPTLESKYLELRLKSYDVGAESNDSDSEDDKIFKSYTTFEVSLKLLNYKVKIVFFY